MTEVFFQIANALVLGLEAIGIAVIMGGFVLATVIWLAKMGSRSAYQAYRDYRRQSVRGLILGLEFLVAADIIRTVAIAYTMESVLMLALIILIRTMLVFALHLEIEGRLPWKQSADDNKT